MPRPSIYRRSLVCTAALCAAMALTGAHADSNTQPVNLLVGFPPGGNVDSVARNLAAGMQNALKRTVVVDNRPGAGGQIAMQMLARSSADGRTLMLSNEHAISIIPMTTRNPGYDPQKDFVPVATVTTLPLALAVHPSVKARNVQELVAWARSQQKTLDVGIPAPASQPQFGVSLLAKRFGIQASPVPYRGGAPMVADLMGGHVLAGLTGISEFLPLHKSGSVRMIAVSGPERLARFPDVPTFTEGGLPGFEERTFMGVFAPAGTPSETVARYREAIRKVVASTEYQQALDELGLQAQFGDGADLAARVKHTNQTWGPVIRESGFVAQ
jgi:tripartite-type tricarboxylate transporter receptor subunit TctC